MQKLTKNAFIFHLFQKQYDTKIEHKNIMTNSFLGNIGNLFQEYSFNEKLEITL